MPPSTQSIRNHRWYLVGFAIVLTMAATGQPTIAAGQNKTIALNSVASGAVGHRYTMFDQFGYRQTDPKIAVLVYPRIEYNATDRFSPNATYGVRRASNDSMVYFSQIKLYNNGKMQPSSGDRGYWSGFSIIRDVGSFFLYDPTNMIRLYVRPTSSGYRILRYQENNKVENELVD